MTSYTGQSPLPSSCIKGLTDKVYDKRKSAALEIEKLVQAAVSTKDLDQVGQIVKLLKDLTYSQPTAVKKGGMIGLAAVAAGLGTQHIQVFCGDIANPIIACLSDNSGQVRYYASESIYNVMRVARHHILPVFNDIFSALVQLIADPDSNVCTGADMLDNTLKAIVKERGELIKVDTIIPIIRSKIYNTNIRIQTLLVSWVGVLHAIPSIDLAPVLTEILDGLMVILKSNHIEVATATESLLTSLLEHCRDNSEGVNCLDLTSVVVVHARSPNSAQKIMALCWLNELITLGGRDLLPQAASILSAALPSVKTHKVAEEVSLKIMKLMNPEVDDGIVEEGGGSSVNISDIVSELLRHLKGDSEQCKFIALRWLVYLQRRFPNKMRAELINLCNILLPVLGDKSDALVVLVLQLYASIARTKGGDDDKDSPYFKDVISIILNNLRTDAIPLAGRGALIFRELCVLLSPTEVYVVTSQLLQEQTQFPDFVSNMSSILATILITSSELLGLRMELRKLETTESCEVFVSLFKCWSHNPISVLLLCLLSQSYKQSALLVREVAQIEITVDFLVEVDKLVQLLECPIFTYLRLDLLSNDESSAALIDTLYGLLMVLPQSKSFTTLATRLNNLPPPHRTTRLNAAPTENHSTAKSTIDFENLMTHFRSVQQKKREVGRRAVFRKIEDVSSVESLLANASLEEASPELKSVKHKPPGHWSTMNIEPY